MRLLLDECVPKRLKNYFAPYEISTIEEANFKGLKNGNLFRAANGKFDVLITVDKNIEYQQNKNALPLAVIILSAYSNRFETLLPLIPEALKILEKIKIGEIVRVSQNIKSKNRG